MEPHDKDGGEKPRRPRLSKDAKKSQDATKSRSAGYSARRSKPDAPRDSARPGRAGDSAPSADPGARPRGRRPEGGGAEKADRAGQRPARRDRPDVERKGRPEGPRRERPGEGGEGRPRRPEAGGKPRRNFGQRHENVATPSAPREGGYSRRRGESEGGYSRRRGEGEHYRASEAESGQAPADQELKLVATCALGLELIVGRELEALGLGPIARQNAQVSFPYSPHALAKANYWLRSADRVWLQLAEFPCRDFEELYQGVHGIPWADMLPRDAWFPVEAITTKSRLESEPSIQAVAKKAAVEKMSATYGRAAFSESGARFAIRVFIVYDRARVFVDTSGEGLHRRGYRTYNAKAPLRETVAAGIVLLSHWTPERELYDPMCGSGTILLEAAGIGMKKAAGLDRSFAAQRWDFVGKPAWEEVHKEARDLLVRRAHLRLYGSDIDGRVLKLAREHTEQAGFEGMGVNFQKRDVAEFATSRQYGVLITNPPYGKRLESPEKVEALTQTMARVFAPLHETWSLYFFTAFESFLEHYGREPERVRKIYNGTIPCQLYQYPGPKPPDLGSGDGARGTETVRKRIRLNP